ncbi:MAG: hypothetical protein AAF771_03465 [Pseudomonadota bacterium]
MIFVLTPSNLRNPSALEARSLPKQIFGRSVTIIPKGVFFSRVFWRLVFEHALTRYLIALTPFPIAMLIWPHLALPISQAPLLMFIAIWFFESRVLSIPPDKRRGLVDRDEAARVTDRLRERSLRALTRIAAARQIERGDLHLVVEQSEMARVPPFGYVSVQHDAPGGPELLDLTADEETMILETLFDEDLTEKRLLHVNFSQSQFLRNAVLDPQTISAHARMAALAG